MYKVGASVKTRLTIEHDCIEYFMQRCHIHVAEML